MQEYGHDTRKRKLLFSAGVFARVSPMEEYEQLGFDPDESEYKTVESRYDTMKSEYDWEESE